MSERITRYIVLFLLILVGLARGQAGIDARSVGMAFSNSAAAMGAEFMGMNPAALALVQKFKFELNLASMNLSVFNNSFNKQQYDRYFTTGDTLQPADIQDMLNAIPASGFRVDFDANANLFSVYARNLSLSLTGMGNGYLNLPREFYELALQGNQNANQVYSFDTFDALAWGGLAANLSISIPLKRNDKAPLNLFAIGVTGKYLKGLAYFETVETLGKLVSRESELSAQASVLARTARGGRGFGIDAGLLLQHNRNTTLSLMVSNVLGTVLWSQEPRAEYLEYDVRSVAFDLESFGLPEFKKDSNYVQTDSSYAIDPFSTRLPVTLKFGIAHNFTRKWLVTAQVEKGFTQSMGASNALRIALGTELRYIPLLPIRAGVSVGGKYGSVYSVGAGLDLKYWFADIAVMNFGGISPAKGKGLTLAATTRFRF